ncbi:Lrp/AsnC family transcriptional regulator [Sulfurivermis fontis]|uniref:Lrp/AsnC family transcriptional regulator n=1 Tax=Sulfurivermis fontis TaxID=1972068 RepID=UPI000FD88F7E|nr:AsnC family transcriptional regulator [Sulfurivermis fontis]
MDAIDRAIINALQDGFPICARPYAAAAEQLGITEDDLLQRLAALREQNTITRFGPLFHAERLGGALSLVAMRIPAQDFDRVAAQVNAHVEVAHNYERTHEFNMWFVLATETEQQLQDTLRAIEAETGYPVYNMPKLEEYYLNLRFAV